MTEGGVSGAVPDGVATGETERQAREALGRGDRRAVLAILMRGYGDAIYRYCRRLTSSDDLAQEVHQTVFVQAFDGLRQFAGRSSFKTWLYGIARHRSLDLLRAERRRNRRFVHADTLPEGASDHESARDRLERGALAELLERCLRRLAPDVRSAVLLRYVEDLSYPEMAAICRTQPATLQARVSRTMGRLRRCLEEAGWSP